MNELERAYAYVERFYLAHKDFVSLADLMVFSSVLSELTAHMMRRQAITELGGGWLPSNQAEPETWKNGRSSNPHR